MKFSIKDFFSKCDQIRRKLRIRSHLLKKSLMENLIFCAVKKHPCYNGIIVFSSYRLMNKMLTLFVYIFVVNWQFLEIASSEYVL